MQERTPVTAEDIEKYGIDLNNHPGFKEDLQEIIAEDKKEQKSKNKSLVSDADLMGLITLAGYTCRPLTAGDIQIFQRVDNPIFDDDDENAHLRCELHHYTQVIFVLSRDREELRDIIGLSRDKEAFEDMALEFAFEFTVSDIEKSVEQINEMLNSMAAAEDEIETANDEEKKTKKK